MKAVSVTLDDREYVILPGKEYRLLLTGRPDDAAGAIDAVPFAAKAIAGDLRLARKAAGLTQVELALRLNRSQAMVSAAEHGRLRVGTRYVEAVLAACGLPGNWKPARKSRRRARGRAKGKVKDPTGRRGSRPGGGRRGTR